MAGNGAIAGLVAVTGPAGYIDPWAAPIIGAVAGVIVVYGVLWIDQHVDDPVGALAAHGLAGMWGAIACGLFAVPRLAEHNLPGSHGGLFYTGSFVQLGSQLVGIVVVAVFTFATSYAVFWLIAKTYGLRVSAAGRERGPRHLRARHVRLPGAVHPGGRARRLRRGARRHAAGDGADVRS